MDGNLQYQLQWFQHPQQNRRFFQREQTMSGTAPQDSWIYRLGDTATSVIQNAMDKKDSSPGQLDKTLDDPWGKIDAQSAFLGPTLWDDSAFMVDYSALDEFLLGSGLAINESRSPRHEEGKIPTQLKTSPARSLDSDTSQHGPSNPDVFLLKAEEVDSQLQIPETSNKGTHDVISDSTPAELVVFSPSDLALVSQPGHEFDPRTTSLPAEELRPHPMLKKSRKKTIPDDVKDERYWERRKKNNMAAKKSRDTRRLKENQIIMRASFLEKENAVLKAELEKANRERASLSLRLGKYERV